MGTIVVKRDYKELYTNDVTNWLIGNVGDWQTLDLEVEASVEFYPNNSNTLEFNAIEKSIKLTTGKKWSEMGFDLGQNITIYFTINQNGNTTNAYNIIFNTNIILIANDKIYVNNFINNFGLNMGNITLPSNDGSVTFSNVHVVSNVEPEGVYLTYTHLPNSTYTEGNLKSFIDSTTTSFILPDIKNKPINTPFGMSATGMQSGMSVRSVFVTKKGLKAGTYNVYIYKISIEYLISSFFDNISNLETMTLPPYLLGNNSLTDNFKIKFLPVWNNPNTFIENDLKQTERLGNTGWFNENFNELVNVFSIDSVQYFDNNGNVTDALDYYSPTKVSIVVSGVNNVSTDTECGFGFSWIPKYEKDYKNTETPFYRNTFISNGSYIDGYKVGSFYSQINAGAGVNGASIDTKNIKFTDLGGGKISFECIFTPNQNFSMLFDDKEEEDRKYILWVSVADKTLSRNFSDRVSLLADLNTMIKAVPPAGAYDYIQNAFLEHPYSETSVGVEEYNGFVQDDILCRLPFQINTGTTVFKKMRFGVEVYNPSTATRKVLEKTDIDMSQFVIDTNMVPQFNYNQTRGFKLENGNNKNWVRINREPLLDNAGRYGYISYYAFKIRYEDWLAVTGMPADFFDANELNDGFHRDWVHYLETIGWKVNFFTEIDAVENGVLLRYKNTWKFKFADYDTNDLVDTKHSYLRDSDNTLLNVGNDPETGKPLGVVLSNEPTRLEIEYEITDAGTWDINNVYATATIEIDKGAGIMQMRQLSSVWGSESDNPLKPLSGETKLKIVVDSTGKFLTTKCLIDPELLADAIRYRITGRVGCFSNGGNITFGKYEERYEDKYE